MEQQSGTGNKTYYAQRALEELELAQTATDEDAAEAHRKLQRIYLERASVGERDAPANEDVR